ncbi:dipeptide/oligopeptide/nickel ABC transporter ATP-binding protein [Pandoraea vervacti]|uniref:Dipeptide/oligopeptide/nickel ABC transporter ATP-binding protein n=1 Tax=Pandoraea vervacti TaxID=656178 RepID=A0ABN4U6L0_9BURK|nr:ABC transporter ATP-binding protein [Pandoraea vervacti]APD11269.1 dipeptide/oligopeptide/nickel ABC transporter ATP-binding protein [Pandoraea vervacti]
MTALLEAKHLTTMLRGKHGVVTAVDNVSLRVEAGRSLALVGESGSGKSMTCNSLLGLLPSNGKVVQGEVRFKGRDLTQLSGAEMAKVRGREIGMILQDAMTSLNPLLTIGDQVGEIFRVHRGIRDKAELRRLCVQALERVKIPAAQERLDSYPFQFSGGMRQRVSIAINIALSPDLLICDEPTTALDVTVQLQILKLLRELQQQRNMALIFVTHDLHLASQFCDDVAIMYGGRIVESGPIADVFARPAHPYTAGLLRAVPSLGRYEQRLEAIPGQQPGLTEWPQGCRFAPRCAHATQQCRDQYPDWFEWRGAARRSACWQAMSLWTQGKPGVHGMPGGSDNDTEVETAIGDATRLRREVA